MSDPAPVSSPETLDAQGIEIFPTSGEIIIMPERRR
jgi:hypothetical protein